MKPTCSRHLLLVYSCCFMTSVASAQFWEPTPGPYGGEILSLETTHSGDFLVGVTGAGLYRSTDDGITWTPAAFAVNQASILALARKPGDSLILLGTQNEAYRSTDDGFTWTACTGSPTPEAILAFSYQPSTTYWYASTRWQGVFRSTDDGTSWSQMNSGLTDLSMSSIGLDETGNVLLAGTGYSGVYRSTNNGTSWIETNSGLGNLQTTDLLRSSGACFVSTYDGIYRTSSSNWNWSKVTDPGVSAYSLYSDSLSSELFAGTMPGLLHSTDGGASWSSYGTGLPFHLYAVLALTRASHGTLLAALPGPGVFRSTDGGAHWAKSTFGILAQNIHTLASDIAGNIYAGTEHGMLFRSADNGATWDSLFNVSCPVRQILISGQQVYFGTWGTGVRMSTDGGNTFSTSSIAEPVGVHINALAGNPSIGALFVGMERGVYRTTNDGTLWEKVNNGLTDSNVTALFVTPTGRLFCGTGGGLVFTSSDGGAYWSDADSGLPAGSYVWCFAHTMNKIFVGTGIGLFSTTDSGAHWEPSQFSSSTILALATAKNGHLFACTFQGPSRSTDGGITWEHLNDGFVGNSARAFAVNANGYAFVATDGNGIYRSKQKVVTDVPALPDRVPLAYGLEQNYPNPFNPFTIIKYTVGGNRGSGIGVSDVSLVVYDVLGREVAVLVNERKPAGSYEVTFDGSGLSSGVYYIRLTAGSFTQARAMMLVK